MQLEAGKFYRTRDGRKAYVAHLVNPFLRRDFCIGGYIEDEGDELFTWNKNGRFSDDRVGFEHPSDLVAEWTDPPTCRQVCERLLTTCAEFISLDNKMAAVAAMAREALEHEGR
jgi:hypothetical protein